MSDIRVKNFGCRLNALEGDAARAAAQEAGLQHATIINGCAVTQAAAAEARRAARKARRDDPAHTVIVTGCAAQIAPTEFARMPEVDRILGNGEKHDPKSYRTGARVQVGDIHRHTHMQPPPHTPQPRSRAFVQVQNGCDHSCTFCIIPQGRGRARALPVDDVVARCRQLVAEGHREIVLTGVDLTSWSDGAGGLGRLVRAVLEQVPELPRLRLSSIDVAEIDDELKAVIADEPRLAPHLHLSLQAGDDMILKRMKRRHNRAQAVDFCADMRARRPDLVFGADLIAGFPTENDAMFENTHELIAECGLVWLHVFPFSPRPNTPAARMPAVPPEIVKSRAAKLRRAGDRQRGLWLAARVGTTLDALVETPTHARSAHFARIALDAPATPGRAARITITGHDGAQLMGTLL